MIIKKKVTTADTPWLGCCDGRLPGEFRTMRRTRHRAVKKVLMISAVFLGFTAFHPGATQADYTIGNDNGARMGTSETRPDKGVSNRRGIEVIAQADAPGKKLERMSYVLASSLTSATLEMAECFSFYSILSKLASNDGDTDFAAQTEKWANQYWSLAKHYSKPLGNPAHEDWLAERATKLINEFVETANAKGTKEAFSPLMERHGALCKTLARSAGREERVDYWKRHYEVEYDKNNNN